MTAESVCVLLAGDVKTAGDVGSGAGTVAVTFKLSADTELVVKITIIAKRKAAQLA